MPHKRAKRSVREQQKNERGTDLAPSGTSIGTSISTERIPKSAARVLDAARIRAEFRQKRARSRIDDADANDDKSALKQPPPSKKRRTNASAGDAEKSGKASTKGKDHRIGTIEIQPGESLKHFNRRVEDHMRPLVQSAMRTSATTERKERKAVASNKGANKTQQSPGASPSSLTRKRSKAHAEDAQPSSTTSRRDNDDDNDNDNDVLPKEFATASSAAPRRLNDIVMAPPELKKLPRGAAKRSSGGGKAKAGAAAGVLSMAQRAMMEVERENVIRRYREMKERKAKEGDWTLLREGLHVNGGG